MGQLQTQAGKQQGDEPPEALRQRAREAGIVVEDQHAKRRLRVLQQTSASQYSDYERCPRVWFNSSVLGERGPQTQAQARGTDIDDNYVQPYLRTGAIRADGEWAPLLRALIPHLPAPGPREGLGIQERIELPTFDGGPVWLGFPDVVEVMEGNRPGIVVGIDDLKTTSDFRYCKSADELRTGPQSVSYARAGYELLGAREVWFGHVYGRAAADKTPRAHRSQRPHAYGSDKGRECRCQECKAWLSQVNRGQDVGGHRVLLPRDLVDAQWSRFMVGVREMARIAREVAHPDELTPNTEACGAYGGCPYRGKCGLDTLSKLGGSAMSNGTGTTSPLLARLQAARARIAAEGGAPPPAGARGVSPPDAPPRDQVPRPPAAANPAPAAEAPPAVPAAPKKRGAKEIQIGCSKCGQPVASSEFERHLDGHASGAIPVAPPPAPVRHCADCGAALPGGEVKHVGCRGAEKAPPPAAPPQGGKVIPMAPKAETAPSESLPPGTVIGDGVGPIRPGEPDPSSKLLQALKERAAAIPRKQPAQAPILFVDCFPLKGSVPGGQPVALDDWLGPICELAAVANEVPDYRLIDYKAKGVLATAIRESLDTCPAVLLVDSRAGGADVALEVLTPHARLIVRGVR